MSSKSVSEIREKSAEEMIRSPELEGKGLTTLSKKVLISSNFKVVIDARMAKISAQKSTEQLLCISGLSELPSTTSFNRSFRIPETCFEASLPKD